MRMEIDRSVEYNNEVPSKKISPLHKRMIEEKLREIKAIRVAYTK